MTQIPPAQKRKKLFPFQIRPGVTVVDTIRVAELVLNESDAQVMNKNFPTPDAREEYQVGCDALLLWRMKKRFDEEVLDPQDSLDAFGEIRDLICVKRGYDADDFSSALSATLSRVRFPYGISPMELAWIRTLERPMQLVHPELRGTRVPQLVAGIAYELQRQQDDEPILLPIEGLRVFVGARKLIISGVVVRLQTHGLLECTDSSYRIGKARKYRFIGKENTHFTFSENLESQTTLTLGLGKEKEHYLQATS